jgi:hypothetical protein
VPIKVQLIAPPLYVMLSSTPDKDEGIARLSLAIAEVKRVLDEFGGEIVIKMAPCVTTAEHEGELSRMLEGVEADSGDDAEDDEEEGKNAAAEDETLGTLDFEAAHAEDAASAAQKTDAAAMLASVTAAAAAAREAMAAGKLNSSSSSSSAAAVAAAAAAAEKASSGRGAESGEVEVGASIAFTGAKKKKAPKQVNREEDD